MVDKKFVTMKKIKPALIGCITIPPHDETLNSTNDKKKITAKAMNEKAYSELILAMRGELAFEVVDNSTTDESRWRCTLGMG